MNPNIDIKQFVNEAIGLLENQLKAQGHGGDQNLLTAIEILKAYQPSLQEKPESDPSEQLVIAAWNGFVEPEVAKHARPDCLRNRVLFVAVDSEIWFAEIVRHRRKDILGKCRAAVGADTVKTITYEVEACVQKQRVLYALPAPLFSRARKLQSPTGPARKPALDWVHDVLEKAAESAQVRLIVNFDKVAVPSSSGYPGVNVPRQTSQASQGQKDTPPPTLPEEFHLFRQLDMDLEATIGSARSFLGQGSGDLLTAITRGVRLTAARRWSKGKLAESDGNQHAASEMKAFAGFWYRLAERLDMLHDEGHTSKKDD